METEEIQNSDTNIIVPNAGSGEEEDFEREGIAPTTSANGDAPTGDENISHEQGSDAESAVVASSAPRPATFTKVEKSLASLGFFTPSSRRIKNEKVKRVSFTRDVDGKRMEVTAE